MCVKLPPGDLNLGPYPPHSTNSYNCEVIITLMVCSGNIYLFFNTCVIYIVKFSIIIVENFINANCLNENLVYCNDNSHNILHQNT